MYDFLYQYIGIGVENAIHQKQLGERLNIAPAAAKRLVRKARQQGYKIVSGQEGYWIPRDEKDIQDFFSMMSKQAISRLQSISPIKNSLKQCKGQYSLFESLDGATDEVASDEQKESV